MASTPDKPAKAAKVERPAKAGKAVRATKTRATGPVRVSQADLQRLVDGRHHDPHSILGPHPSDSGVTIRTLRPWASLVVVIVRTADGDVRTELTHEHG